MTSGRPRRLLGPTVGSAVVLAVCGLVIWGVALWVSSGSECPQSSQSTGGLDKGISVWPPAAQCVDRHDGVFWHQALPWAPWVIGVLIVSAAAILLVGLLVAIRDLRRPQPVAMRTMPLVRAAHHHEGPSGGPGATRRNVETDEPDRPAMAA